MTMLRPFGQKSTLTRKSTWPVWADVLFRMGLVLLLISLVVLIHWSDREGLVDNYDGHISFLDVVYFTMISVTTTGFGDIAPVSPRARFVEAVIVTPVRIAALFIFVGTAYNFVIKRTWEKWRMKRIQANLRDHIVVVGFGVSGSEAVKELIARGKDPRSIVVIDPQAESLAMAEAMGCNVMQADASRDETLVDVQIKRASAVIVSAGRDDTSILITLTVRHLAQTVPISVVVRAADNELLARQAGANTVINPVNFAGLLLAGSCEGEHIAEYIGDLASVTGRVSLREREVQPFEHGRALRDVQTGIAVRLYRNGQPFGFWEAEAARLQPEDRIVEIIADGERKDARR